VKITGRFKQTSFKRLRFKNKIIASLHFVPGFKLKVDLTYIFLKLLKKLLDVHHNAQSTAFFSKKQKLFGDLNKDLLL